MEMAPEGSKLAESDPDFKNVGQKGLRFWVSESIFAEQGENVAMIWCAYHERPGESDGVGRWIEVTIAPYKDPDL